MSSYQEHIKLVNEKYTKDELQGAQLGFSHSDRLYNSKIYKTESIFLTHHNEDGTIISSEEEKPQFFWKV